ncbi:replication restart DNA helicase PriA [Acaryochloris thomasi]|uniref:replication restart DNA helicase PriA n=1 Tax=Acaryochloris thomasi TaxID=2929456 RepID=UPI000DA6A37B|nr:replication restart DNA helicase PriA [Acaryochloris thomasi]
MKNTHNVCCPNCGDRSASRRYFTSADARKCKGGLVSQIECPACDYLMVTCTEDGRVLEAYSSGLPAPSFIHQPESRSPILQS